MAENDDFRILLTKFLNDNELPLSLLTFITDAMAANKPFEQIVIELRETPEYKLAYPENDLRIANGLSAMTEAEIRSYRNEAKRLTNEYLGIELTNEQISRAIGKGYSLSYWEHKVRVYSDMERWGPTVKAVLAQELGYEPDEEMVYRFLDSELPSPELDRAYENALLRGQPAALGFGIRPEEEADTLRAFGISPEKAFANYQGVAAELPRQERLAFIERELTRTADSFPGAGAALGDDTTFNELFRAIQLQDPTAIAAIQQRVARNVARFQGQGGVAVDNSGASVGLLRPDQR